MGEEWTLRRQGATYAVVGGPGRLTRLLHEGDVVTEGTADYWESVTLTAHGIDFRVHWGARNTITKATATIEDSTVDLVPPPGSRAGRREALARDHPRRYVAQRVASAALQVLLGVLGLGALLSAVVGRLLPSISWDWLPDVPRPDWLHLPHWLRYLDPVYWVSRLDVSLPDWLTSAWDTVAPTSKYWLPLVIAAVIASGEVARRRERDAERHKDQDDDS